ncbi:MAG TPA: type II toxin-antitoxin system VapC family toxin [Acidimicrobiales bacterium]
MSVVVDASVMVEILLKTRTGRAAVARLAGEAAAAPDTLDSEVAQALRRAWRRRAFDDHQLATALDVLADWPLDRVPTRLLVRGSRRWWHNVSAYDSLYLAVALPRGAHVVTCDGPLARAPGTGVPVENVRVV